MPETLERFAARLRQALDHARFPAGRQRTAALALEFNVSRETARKWLSAMALPELERMIEMARSFRVSFEWLATGRGEMALGQAMLVAEPLARYQADGNLDALLAVVSRLPQKKRDALLELLTE